MQAKSTTGLTIGKFAPLHKGHQFLLERALEKCDHLIVLVYDVPELTKVPVETRTDWIRRLYPEVEVINAGVGPKETGDSPEVNRLHIDYVRSKLPLGAKIDSVFSSENYGRYLAEALGAENVMVDKARVSVPISAGVIRRNPEEYRDYVEDFVYEDILKHEK
jgi:cytidyltransferase-like protein